jgi:hypothetical protein
MKTDIPVAIIIALSIPVVFLIINFILMPTILVETTLGRFTFTSGKIVQEIDTYFYVVVMDGKVRPCTIGEHDEFCDQHGALRVDIFKVNDLLPPEINRQDLLDAFVAYGCMKFWNTSRIVVTTRSRVVYKGVETFDVIFNGQQQAAFKRAARAAGAISVKFEQLAV